MALGLGLAACGGAGGGAATNGGRDTQQARFTVDRPDLVAPEPAVDAANRNPRQQSVNYNDPPPSISANVNAAAQTAGCTVKSFPSEADPQNHISGESQTKISVPPLSGAHNPRWADWGVYNQPVPFKHQLHKLEHGGVFNHYGTKVPVEGVNAIREAWAKSPGLPDRRSRHRASVPDERRRRRQPATVARLQTVHPRAGQRHRGIRGRVPRPGSRTRSCQLCGTSASSLASSGSVSARA